MGKKKKKGTKITQRRMPVNWPALLGFCGALLALGVAGYFLSRSQADTTQGITPPVMFSEVMTANTSSVKDDLGQFSDWFEIVNDSERAIDLHDWMVMKEADKVQVFTFDDVQIRPGECLVVFCSDRSQNKPGYALHAPFGLGASGESLILMDGKGQIVDRVDVPSLNRNQVYARRDGEWTVTGEYTPGLPNTDQAYQSVVSVQSGDAAVGVEISEVLIKNAATIADDQGEYSDYIELHNRSGRSVNLRGYMLTDDENAPDKFVFPDVTLPAGGYMLVFASGREQTAGTLHASFKLSKGESVSLFNEANVMLSSATPRTDGADQAWSLTKNGWTALYPPTPGYANDENGVTALDTAMDAANTTHLHISEVMAQADAVTVDREPSDWIEIYNDAQGAVDLSGWGLSDSSSHPRKWQFPSGTSIPAGSYMVVVCDGADGKSGNYYHTNFALGHEGGYSVTLCDPNGTVVDRLAVNRQYSDISYGRSYGVAGIRYFLEPSPGEANTGYGYTGHAQQAVYSKPGGLYNEGESIVLELSAAPGSTIYYTTDCSDPDTTSNVYTGPLSITSDTILRTRVYAPNEIPSFVATESYFFDVHHTMRVVSLVTDPVNLWDENEGIYVMGPNATDTYPYGSNNKGANFWMDWEKSANVEIFTTDGETLLSQQCGLKLQGQYSRAEDQKAFRLIARSDYSDQDIFAAALFSDRPYTEYHSFLLRASGQDSKKTRIRDVLQTSLADATDVMYQAAEMCVVYLNGQYWGHYNMREHISKYSICQWEGWTSNPDDIDIVKANRDARQGSNENFQELLDWIKKEGGAAYARKNENLTQADYDAILDHISKYVDVDNYLDYVAVQIYTGNTDLLNVKRYRSVNEDGLWRWILFDMDWGFDYLDTNQMRRWLDPAGAGSGKKTDNTLFVELMSNPAIQDKFLKRFNELFVSTFNAEEVVSRMNALAMELEPEIDQHLERWGISRSQYDSAWQKLRNVVTNRPEYVMNYMQETFDFTDEEMQYYFADSLKLIEVYKALHS